MMVMIMVMMLTADAEDDGGGGGDADGIGVSILWNGCSKKTVFRMMASSFKVSPPESCVRTCACIPRWV